jgi:XTP/dITP diphosphohydrolase
VLLSELRGTQGFGYDPLLHIPSAGCTVAELTPEQKNGISHRALAAAQMVRLMQQAWHL